MKSALSCGTGSGDAFLTAFSAERSNPASPLLGRCRAVYRDLYQRDPEVRALHAGLECAVIGRTYPGMDMISIGPTTENAHSPTERLQVPSLHRIAEFLRALLTSMTPE